MKYQVTVKNPAGENRLDVATNLLFVGYSTENGNSVLVVGDDFRDSDIAAMLYTIKACYKDVYKQQDRMVKRMIRAYTCHCFWKNLKNKFFGIKEDNN